MSLSTNLWSREERIAIAISPKKENKKHSLVMVCNQRRPIRNDVTKRVHEDITLHSNWQIQLT